MLNKLLIVLAASLLSFSVYAEPPEFEIGKGFDFRQEAQAAMKAAVSEEDVGDPDSFARPVKYLGVVSTVPVNIQPDCTGFDPDSGVCVETSPAPAATNVDETDLGMIALPGKSTKSLLCFTATQFSTWIWNNSTAAQATANMGLYITVQIESEVLMGLVDSDGVPFNGSLFVNPTPIIVSTQQHTLPAGAVEIQRQRDTRSCTGGFVSASALETRGLTKNQIKKFFKKPMTVTFNVAGSVSLVDFAVFFSGIRLYGD